MAAPRELHLPIRDGAQHMTLALRSPKRWPVADDLAYEEHASERNECIDGVICAMIGNERTTSRRDDKKREGRQ